VPWKTAFDPHNPWLELRRLTPARIALGRTGTSLPTSAQLDFQFAHAQARDAVHLPFDHAGLSAQLANAGATACCCTARPRSQQLPATPGPGAR
jgi:ethanolamine ammonia-lyase small subunit